MKLRNIIALASIAAFGFTACGSDEKSGSSTSGTTASEAATTGAATGAAFNDADAEFAQGMIPHHEQAIEMADIALDPTVGASDVVKELATRIKGEQDPEIQLMTGWLTAWGQPIQMTADSTHDMSSMEGMMSADDMDMLSSAMGVGFDKIWQEMMIKHHDGAIAMAQAEKANGSNPEALALADQIIVAQQTEIDEMTANLG
ncbi:MAG: DUF305 domain-containing protein [Ilumatobacteraceae bacterium]